MKPLVDMLHLLICQQPHIYDIMKIVHREDGFCYYYLETDIADGEHLPDHVKWQEIVNKFTKSIGASSDKEALEFVKKCIDISQSIRELVGTNQAKMQFLQTLINL